MSGTRYRRGKNFAADMAMYTQVMAEDNSEQMGRLRRNVMLALREDVTPRQRECMLLYYEYAADRRVDGDRQVHGVPHHQTGRVPAAPLPALWGGAAAGPPGVRCFFYRVRC